MAHQKWKAGGDSVSATSSKYLSTQPMRSRKFLYPSQYLVSRRKLVPFHIHLPRPPECPGAGHDQRTYRRVASRLLQGIAEKAHEVIGRGGAHAHHQLVMHMRIDVRAVEVAFFDFLCE